MEYDVHIEQHEALGIKSQTQLDTRYLKLSDGATTALDNLASVAINTSLISDTDSTDNLGSSSKYWASTYTDKLYLNATASLDGSSAGTIFTTGHIVPYNTVTDSLGAFDRFFDKIWINAQCYITGSTAGKVTIDGTNGQLYVKGISQLVGGVYTDLLVGATGGAILTTAINKIGHAQHIADAGQGEPVTATGDLVTVHHSTSTWWVKWCGNTQGTGSEKDPKQVVGPRLTGTIKNIEYAGWCPTLNVDTGAVNRGDLLVPSSTTGKATVNNDPAPGTVIGMALSGKAAGSVGSVEAWIYKGGGGGLQYIMMQNDEIISNNDEIIYQYPEHM